MTDLSPGQEVTVSPSGITAEVLYVRGETVRVRNVNSGKARTVAIKNVTPKRESKVLSVEAPQLRSLADMVAPMQRVYDSGIRPVPIKNVTPKRESKVLSVSAEELAAARQLGMRHPSIPNPLARPMERTASPLRPVPKPVTLTNPAYLAYVRKHPCCLCGASPSEAHHWSHHGGVMGAKVDDYRTIPLCDPCHMGEWHRTGTFSGMSREASEALMLRVQRELLLAWTATRIWDGDMVDALIRAIGGADA